MILDILQLRAYSETWMVFYWRFLLEQLNPMTTGGLELLKPCLQFSCLTHWLKSFNGLDGFGQICCLTKGLANVSWDTSTSSYVLKFCFHLESQILGTAVNSQFQSLTYFVYRTGLGSIDHTFLLPFNAIDFLLE